MCGIAGILNRTTEPADRTLLEEMTRLLSHRGPDDEGFYVNGRVGLGHRRLSIIDLSPAGHQPMSNEDESVWITFNGEIYNYRDLIPELISHGHQFRSRCDTEVILHAYEQWGDACTRRFNGIWAFALWDSRRRRLFCSRDHLGVKPFYYFFNGQVFLFASEIKALLLFPQVEAKPEWERVYQYYAQGRMDIDVGTLYSDILQLAPAHNLTVDEVGIRTERFWEVPVERETRFASDEQYAKSFLELFTDAVRLQMHSDAPLGTCLSGGLDSSSIVCTAASLDRRAQERYRAFISFADEPQLDERPYAQEVIQATGFVPEWIRPSGGEFVEEIPRMLWHHDEPIIGPSMYMQWNVMRRARDCQIKVLLDGQGGDELLAGYPPFYLMAMVDYLRKGRIMSCLRTWNALWDSGTPYLSRMMAHTLNRFLPARLRGISGLLYSQQPAEASLADSTLRPERRFHSGNYVAEFPGKSSLSAGLLRSLIHPLRAILHMEDRSSMAFGIEARVPFLDYRLVELAVSLPDEQKLADGLTKVVLRNAMKGVLPERIRQRRMKLGFNAAEDRWLRTEAHGAAREILYSQEFERSEILNARRCRELFEEHVAGRMDIGGLIWRWLCLHFWCAASSRRKISTATCTRL